MQKKANSLTEGSIYRSMLLFALPVLLRNIFQQLYNTFDAWCVGNYIGANVHHAGLLVLVPGGIYHCGSPLP